MRNLITLFLSVTMMIGLCSCTDRKIKLYKATISASVCTCISFGMYFINSAGFR